MSDANRLPRTLVLQGYRVVGKSKYTMKITSQLTNGNKIQRKIRNIKYEVRGKEGRGQTEPMLR